MTLKRCIVVGVAVLAGVVQLSTAPALARSAWIFESQFNVLAASNPKQQLAVDASGNVYAADAAKGLVKYDAAGEPVNFSASQSYINGFELTGTPTEKFNEVSGVAVGPAGVLFVDAEGTAGSFVNEFNAAGEYQRHFSVPGDGAVAADRSGDVYAAVHCCGTEAVYKYNAAGELTMIDGETTPAGSFVKPYGVAVDGEGNLYVTDLGSSVVDKFNAAGEYVSTINGETTPAGSLDPIALSVDSSGSLYVAEFIYQVVDQFSGTTGEYERQITGPPEAGFGDYVWSVASNASGTTLYASTRSEAVYRFGFRTLVAPAVNDRPPSLSELTTDRAVVLGTLNPGGLATQYWVEYVEASGYEPQAANPYIEGVRTEHAHFAGSIADESAGETALTGLLAGTTYHYRLVGRNEEGTTYGPDYTFSTPSSPPTAATAGTSGIGPQSATISGSVSSGGLATRYAFELGASAGSYGEPLGYASIGAGESNVPVALNLQGLDPGTTYHYRIVATNVDGTSYGADRTFTTATFPDVFAAPPAPLPFVSVPNIAFPSEASTPVAKKKATKKKPKKKGRGRGKPKKKTKKR